MVRSALFVCLALVMGSASAQKDSSFILMQHIEADVADVAIDRLDNIYIVSPSGQIKKINAQGDSVAIYNQVRNFGMLTSMDVSNPLKLILFYKDFSTVVILDRFLTVRNTIDLRRSSVYQPAAVALSYDNNIWIFDGYDSKLKRMDEQGKILSETTDLRAVFPQAIAPQKIIDDNGLVYIADTSAIYLFDIYGGYKRKMPSKGLVRMAVNNGFIILSGKSSVQLLQPSTSREQHFQIPDKYRPYQYIMYTGNRLLLWDGGAVRLYRVGD